MEPNELFERVIFNSRDTSELKIYNEKYIVYLIVDENGNNYVGKTRNFIPRMAQHKYNGKLSKNISEKKIYILENCDEKYYAKMEELWILWFIENTECCNNQNWGKWKTKTGLINKQTINNTNYERIQKNDMILNAKWFILLDDYIGWKGI